MKISELFVKYHQNDLTPDEKTQLDNWINLSENNRMFFAQWQDPEYVRSKLLLRRRIEARKESDLAKIRAIMRLENPSKPTKIKRMVLWISHLISPIKNKRNATAKSERKKQEGDPGPDRPQY